MHSKQLLNTYQMAPPVCLDCDCCQVARTPALQLTFGQDAAPACLYRYDLVNQQTLLY
jgi:hypothetical protein